MDALHALLSGPAVHAKPDIFCLVVHAQLVLQDVPPVLLPVTPQLVIATVLMVTLLIPVTATNAQSVIPAAKLVLVLQQPAPHVLMENI